VCGSSRWLFGVVADSFPMRCEVGRRPVGLDEVVLRPEARDDQIPLHQNLQK
jgi:hypothetical protein